MVLKLKDFFPFSLIDAMGTLAECEAQIARELRYQSSLDLHEEVYRRVTPIPLVTEIVNEARMVRTPFAPLLPGCMSFQFVFSYFMTAFSKKLTSVEFEFFCFGMLRAFFMSLVCLLLRR
jgi:hypothetical protein